MSVCEQHGVAKKLCWTLPRNLKDKLVEYCAKHCVDASASNSGEGVQKKNVRTGKDAAMDAAVMMWYVHQRSVGMNICSIEATKNKRFSWSCK